MGRFSISMDAHQRLSFRQGQGLTSICCIIWDHWEEILTTQPRRAEEGETVSIDEIRQTSKKAQKFGYMMKTHEPTKASK